MLDMPGIKQILYQTLTFVTGSLSSRQLPLDLSSLLSRGSPFLSIFLVSAFKFNLISS